RVDLLGVEPDVVGEAHELVHQLRRLLDSTSARERLREPEGAGQEGTVRAGDTVLARVAVDERTVPRFAPAGVDRGREPLPLRVDIPEQDAEQQARVELLATGEADIAPFGLRP